MDNSTAQIFRVCPRRIGTSGFRRDYPPRLCGRMLCWLVMMAAVPLWAQSSPACTPTNGHYPCVYVGNIGSETGSVTVIDGVTNMVVSGSPINLPQLGANGIAVSPDNSTVYVGTQDVEVIDTASGTWKQTISTTGNSSGGAIATAITPNGSQAWVAEPGSGFIDVIDIGTNTIVHTFTNDDRISNPTAMTFSLDGTLAYAADTCLNESDDKYHPCVDVFDTATYIPVLRSPFLDLTKKMPVE